MFKMNEKRINQRLRTFDTIISSYTNKEPFSRFLAQYFKENKQMGSNDRRIATRLSYNFFRLGNTLIDLSPHQRLAIADFLCEDTLSDIALYIYPELEERQSDTFEEKLLFCQEKFDLNLDSLFPLIDQVSDAIDKKSFIKSHFIQPNLFIRIHPQHTTGVVQSLKDAEIEFQVLAENTLSFANGTKLDSIKEIQGKYEVQDHSSQQTAQLYKQSAGESWWDACAGSGGKSIPLMHDVKDVQLMVSDIRNSILKNLDTRFTKAGISKYRRKVIDLTKENTILKDERFDGMILDIPCSGSGTWGRTPEMLSSFNEDQLETYNTLQRDILNQILNYLRPGKPLIYITCSVYHEENENMVKYLEELGMKVESMQYYKGYDKRADTLFAARLIQQ